MSKIIINSPKVLNGEVYISGSKNSALPILASTILIKGKCTLENIVPISDVKSMTDILSYLNCKVELKDDKVHIDSSNVVFKEIPSELTNKLRASFIIAGPLLALFKKAHLAMPGGCTIGQRPVDLHLKGFKNLGYEYEIKDGLVNIFSKCPKSNKVYLDFPSVGATQNLIMASVFLNGNTIIENCASEPEITDLCDFLNMCGAHIKGGGTDKIEITGVKELKEVTYRIIPDRIEAGTFMIASMITKGNLRLKNINSSHLFSLSSKLMEIGAEISIADNELTIKPSGEQKTCDVKTMPFPGFPTDMQSQMATLLCLSKGTSMITETIFENRFMYVPELLKMNADIKIDGRNAVIKGKDSLSGANVNATDLRAGASLVLAGLCADGKTIIDNANYIDRGYYKFVDKLKMLGADIKMEE